VSYENTYSPKWAPHVVGSFETRAIDESGLPEEKKVEARCSVCGGTFQRTCTSGLMRQWINTFASAHVHPEVPR
jgi:hypothetical protein